jgi:hypothetical protein
VKNQHELMMQTSRDLNRMCNSNNNNNKDSSRIKTTDRVDREIRERQNNANLLLNQVAAAKHLFGLNNPAAAAAALAAGLPFDMTSLPHQYSAVNLASAMAASAGNGNEGKSDSFSRSGNSDDDESDRNSEGHSSPTRFVRSDASPCWPGSDDGDEPSVGEDNDDVDDEPPPTNNNRDIRRTFHGSVIPHTPLDLSAPAPELKSLSSTAG